MIQNHQIPTTAKLIFLISSLYLDLPSFGSQKRRELACSYPNGKEKTQKLNHSIISNTIVEHPIFNTIEYLKSLSIDWERTKYDAHAPR